MSKSKFSKKEIMFLEKMLADASNASHRSETLEAIELFEQEDILFLVHQLGVVNTYKDIEDGRHLYARYDDVGRILWQKSRQQIRDAICGDSDTYKEERAKLQSNTENAIIILVPLILSALGIPQQASGVAIVISLMILKIGLKTFCATVGDLKKLRGKPGQVCAATGRYINLQEGTTETVFKGTRFPKGSTKSEWVFFEEVAGDA